MDKELEKLKELKREADSCDRDIFSEQRVNVLLKNGEHYRKASDFSTTDRGIVKRTDKKRLHLVKNHIHRICNLYSNAILEDAPIPMAEPYNESDLHDKKAAKFDNAIYNWVRQTNKWDTKNEDFVEDFVVLTECFCRVWFNYDKGFPIAMDAATGQTIMSGEFELKRVLPYDVKRDPDAKTLDDSRFLIEEDLIKKSELINLAISFGADEDKIQKIKQRYKGSKTNVFDSSRGRYKEVTGKVAISTIYWKPCKEMPKGRYTIFTEDFIIGSKDLPLGIFPWAYTGFDRLTNSPRHSGIVRVAKPYQVEYNRANSKMAEHQITLGDDRVYLTGGSSMTGGKLVHGVRQYHVTGSAPVIQSGRSGVQYLEYARDTRSDMYEACNIDYATLNKSAEKTADPFQMLYLSIKDKKKFVKYVGKYERFVIDIFSLVSKMAKSYVTPLHMIKVAGEREFINIQEYKQMDDTGFEIKTSATSTDVESKFGKILTLTQVLQYVGSSLQPEQIAQVVKEMPYATGGSVINAVTLKTENAENLILALDRGEYPESFKYDDHEFLLNALYGRMKQSDFYILPDNIKMMYQQKIMELQTFVEQKIQEAQRANMGMIPASGFLTTVNTSWTNPDTGKVERIKLPTEAVFWLANKLREQGVFSNSLGAESMNIMAGIGGQPQANPQLTEEQIIAPQVQGGMNGIG